MEFYGQNQEDRFIEKYFAVREKSELFMLDIGANDGKTLSNSYKAIQQGWNAVLVEPSPVAFERLNALHGSNARVRLFNCAITAQTGEAVLHESGTLLNKGDSALVSTLIPEEKKRWDSAKIPFQERLVKTKSFNDLLMECSSRKFQCISIDAEGFDFQILSQINLTDVGCELLVIEWNGNVDEKDRICRYTGGHAMKLVDENAENLIFILVGYGA
ncbi:MAG: FkbM family methyltransferase [Candidatus Marinimicrobia bacterium]|nr:FkbM family methyltransferase [Candidatus Neomarinimicrobiota bacterium]